MKRPFHRFFDRLLAAALALLLLMLFAPSVHAADTAALEQALIDSCTYEQRVDLSQYAITVDTLEATYQDLYSSNRLPWYANSAYNYSYDTTTNVVTEFIPAPLTGIDKTRYEQRVAEILDACVLEGMSQWQIALAIHDYLIANACYDESLVYNDSYHLLVDGTAVCAGYAKAYQDLLTRAGIPCVYVVSDAMDHAWNLVQIGTSWYHVDLTWDDPTPDAHGFVSHQYFLLTDAEISAGEEPHHGWTAEVACTDSTFSDAFWKDVKSQICFTDRESCYFIRENDFNNRIISRSCTTGSETVLYTDKINYVNIGSGSYAYSRVGLSLWDGRLYFCSSTKVYSMLTDGTDLKTEYQYQHKSNRKVLYGCFTDNGTLYLSVMNHDGDLSTQTQPTGSGSSHTHSYDVTVNAPTCLEPGSTVSVCACGLRCESDPTAATGHSYQQTESKEASYFSDGYTVQTCTGCGDAVTETVPRLRMSAEEGAPLAAAAVAVVILLVTRKRKVRA